MLEAGEIDGMPYLCMPLLQGQSLSAYIDAALKGGDGVLRPGDGAPPAVLGAIGTLAPAPVWSSARVQGGEGRILVSRRRGGQTRWQHDLWLAERLADALAPRG